jgi:hypothetical protein
MKLENQVCSLELSKKLKELGVKQESLFWWFCDGSQAHRIIYGNTDVPMTKYTLHSAFTVAELGELLPLFVDTSKNDKGEYYTETIASVLGWKDDQVFFEKTEAGARAKMLIYLLENKLITL